MIGDAIAALVGSRIERGEGGGGALGALAGVVTWKVARTVVPAVLVIGGAALAAGYISRRLQQRGASA